MGNGGVLDPNGHKLLISARVEDITVFRDEDGTVSIGVSNFTDGIEVVHDSDQLWWPV